MIAVTGGAGFIGSHLVRQLVQANQRVRVIDLPTASRAHLPPECEFVIADIRDRAAMRTALEGCSHVYHLAADPNLWARRRSHFHEVNYLGTVNVLSVAIELGAKRILHCSTESILTRARQTTPIGADQVVPIDEVIGPYCLSKHRAEAFAMKLARAGHPIVIVNPTLPVGPGDSGMSPPTRMMFDFVQGKRSAYLDADLNMIDVRDVALGMQRAMAIGEPGRRYLLGAEEWSVKRVFDCLADLTGLPRARYRVPYHVALLAAYGSEFVANCLTGEMPAATITGVKLTQRRMQFDAAPSLALLGIKPRPVAESIREALDWFRSQRLC